MSRADIISKVADAVEALRQACPGTGPADSRAEARRRANEIVSSLPDKWWRSVPDDLLQAFTALS